MAGDDSHDFQPLHGVRGRNGVDLFERSVGFASNRRWRGSTSEGRTGKGELYDQSLPRPVAPLGVQYHEEPGVRRLCLNFVRSSGGSGGRA